MGQLLFADQIHMVEQAKIDAARITQKSGNERRGAATALQQFSSSLSNARVMDAAGSQINDSAANTARLHDAATNRTIQGRLATAEELGSMAAMAGAAGVGGASVDAYNETVRLRAAMQEQQIAQSMQTQVWASDQQRGNTIKAAVAAQDNNVYRANIDYTQYVDHQKPSFIEQTIGIGLTAAATVFGGPQAGAAVMGVFEARQAIRNGDTAGASSAITGSVQNGMSAASNYNRTHGGPGDVKTTPDNSQTQWSAFNFKTPEWGSSFKLH